jgi:hypothetical protein
MREFLNGKRHRICSGQLRPDRIYGNTTFALTQVEANTPSAGEATYLGTITGGGSNAFANFTFYISGFTNAGNNSLANGSTMEVISSTATQLVVTSANAVNETSPGQVLAIGSLICGTSSTSNPSNGWNTLTPSGCGTLSATTIYWVANYTNNNTQGQGTSNVSGSCPDGSAAFAGLGLSTAFTNSTVSSINPWPSTLPAYGIGTIYGGTSNSSPCHSGYAALSCTSTNHYDFLQVSVGNCDITNTIGCTVSIPATQGGNESLLVA